MSTGHLPPEASLDDVKVRIRKSFRNPNVGRVEQVVLKHGPRAFKLATLFEIVEPTSKTFHHYSLRLDHIDHRKKDGWFYRPEKSMRLEGKEPDEIERLHRFLEAHQRGELNALGDLHIIRGEDYAKLEKILDSLPNLSSNDKIALVSTVLSQLEPTTDKMSLFLSAFQSTHSTIVGNIAHAATLVGLRRALSQLRELIADPEVKEVDLQALLQEHPWMFGSEYSALIDRRTWTRDEQLDFMLRRTVDDYLEIVEIKTPFSDALFVQDRSRNILYPSAKLSASIGQTMHHIEEVDRNRDSIISQDGRDTLKMRARIIIGRDGSREQQGALRNLNGHLHRIEVLTFDQLQRVAGRVLHVLEPPVEEGSDVPGDPPF